METQREQIALEIQFVRHNCMRLGLECRLDYTAARIPRLEEQVTVAHPMPFPEMLGEVLRNVGMLSRIQSGLGLSSRAKPGCQQRFAQLADVGHVRAAQNGSSRRDERKQNVVSLGLNKPAEREEFYPSWPPRRNQCDHLISGDRA